MFDIDGTLTPKPIAFLSVREHAASAVRLYADSGYKIIYLSARVRILQSGIPDWLKQNHFPEGSIHVPQSLADSSDHAAFKARILKQYSDKGWSFVAAYGDSTSDFEAYAAAGIKQDRVFALQREGATACEPEAVLWTACLNSWNEHQIKIGQIVQR